MCRISEGKLPAVTDSKTYSSAVTFPAKLQACNNGIAINQPDSTALDTCRRLHTGLSDVLTWY
jgi:hypothetical protein